MAMKPAKLCKCGRVLPGGSRCQQCNRHADKQRGTARQRGYTTQWDKYAKAYLREHPLCVYCKAKGRDVPATCVDHIKPADKFPELFWDESNHAAACTPCNVAKGGRVDF